MSFLREGAISNLLLHGPSKGELVNWAAENLIYSDNPYEILVQYAEEKELSIPELEALTNIYLTEDNSRSVNNALSDILLAMESRSIRENLDFGRGGSPYEKIGVGKASGGDYLWGKYPYKDKSNVTYLQSTPVDPDGVIQYRAVMYQDPSDKWVLSIESLANPERVNLPAGYEKGGWDKTPGEWYLETLLDRAEYNTSDDLLIDAGSGWKITNMNEVLNEAKKITDKYINKNTNMKESILMPRFRGRITLNEEAQCSDDVAMAKMHVKSIMDDAGEILRALDQCEELDAWIQSNLSLAENYLSDIRKNLQYKEESKPTELPLIPSAEEETPAEFETMPEDDFMMPSISVQEPSMDQEFDMEGPGDMMGPDDDMMGPGDDMDLEGEDELIDTDDMELADDELGDDETEFDMGMFDEPEGETDMEPDEKDLQLFSKG
jgi:hypothetical protein